MPKYYFDGSSKFKGKPPFKGDGKKDFKGDDKRKDFKKSHHLEIGEDEILEPEDYEEYNEEEEEE